MKKRALKHDEVLDENAFKKSIRKLRTLAIGITGLKEPFKILSFLFSFTCLTFR